MFKVVIQGRTIQELRTNIATFEKSFYSADIQPEPAKPGEQEDFLTHAAAQFPRSSPKPSDVQPEKPTNITFPQVQEEPESEPVSPNPLGADSKGMPWDSRIHASSGAKKADGSWRYRRGVEDHQIVAVEQELIAKARNQQAAQMVETPVVPPIPHIPPVVQAPVAQVALPVTPPPIPVPQPPQLPNVHTVETFKKNLVQVLARLAAEGKVTQPYIQQLKEHFQVAEIHLVNDQQAEEIFNTFVQIGILAKV